MKPMKTNKAALLFCASLVLVAVFLIPIKAKADNWVELPEENWFNSDYTIVDRETGFVVVEVALGFNNDGHFAYHLLAIDCDTWNSVWLDLVSSQGRNYEINPKWRITPSLIFSIPQGRWFDTVARRVCPDRYNLPNGDIR
ncbi:MAG: hypothetical protein IIB64_06650 [Proteobacteria bacterium]|nr:hypothetical protein [Pseudomonadota bacterium]